MHVKKSSSLTPEQLDAILPQTQCGLCGYSGCMPYAEALVFENAPINLCPPGGVETLQALGTLLEQDPTPFINEMKKAAKPAMLAVIREDECIGCMKCIQACPVDAILGSAKQMHTVIADECTGCELCVAPCPVDCIDLITLSENKVDPSKSQQKRDLARVRFNQRQVRLNNEKVIKNIEKKAISLTKRKRYIEDAIQRAKAKKHS